MRHRSSFSTHDVDVHWILRNIPNVSGLAVPRHQIPSSARPFPPTRKKTPSSDSMAELASCRVRLHHLYNIYRSAGGMHTCMENAPPLPTCQIRPFCMNVEALIHHLPNHRGPHHLCAPARKAHFPSPSYRLVSSSGRQHSTWLFRVSHSALA